jgi:hypothetical protein
MFYSGSGDSSSFSIGEIPGLAVVGLKGRAAFTAVKAILSSEWMKSAETASLRRRGTSGQRLAKNL